MATVVIPEYLRFDDENEYKNYFNKNAEPNNLESLCELIMAVHYYYYKDINIKSLTDKITAKLHNINKKWFPINFTEEHEATVNKAISELQNAVDIIKIYGTDNIYMYGI